MLFLKGEPVGDRYRMILKGGIGREDKGRNGKIISDITFLNFFILDS